MKTSDLKKLTIMAKNGLNGSLRLKRTKSVKYLESEYWDLLNFLSCRNVCAEDGSTYLDGPTGKALLKEIQKLGLEEVESQYDKIFLKKFKKLFRKKKPRVIAIIDVHEQETYSKEKRISLDIRGGKHKNGTNFFFKYATIQILSKDEILTMKVHLWRKDEDLASIVEELVRVVQAHAKIDVLLLDRGFRSVNILNELEYLHVPMLMPCVMDDKAKKALAKVNKSCRFSLRNNKGEYADARLLKMVLPNGKTIGFYTTMCTLFHNARYYLQLYAKRWTIETGYRIIKQFLPKTTSIKGVVRLFYFSYAVAMHNLWLCIKNKLKKVKFTVTKMKIIIEHTLNIAIYLDTG